MTKSELIEILAARQVHLKSDDVDLAVKTLLEQMSASLANGDRIEIRGFGSFSLHYRPPRIGRNPKTGESVALPGKYVPHFKPGKELRERVNAVVPLPQDAGADDSMPAGRVADPLWPIRAQPAPMPAISLRGCFPREARHASSIAELPPHSCWQALSLVPSINRRGTRLLQLAGRSAAGRGAIGACRRA